MKTKLQPAAQLVISRNPTGSPSPFPLPLISLTFLSFPPFLARTHRGGLDASANSHSAANCYRSIVNIMWDAFELADDGNEPLVCSKVDEALAALAHAAAHPVHHPYHARTASTPAS